MRQLLFGAVSGSHFTLLQFYIERYNPSLQELTEALGYIDDKEGDNFEYTLDMLEKNGVNIEDFINSRSLKASYMPHYIVYLTPHNMIGFAIENPQYFSEMVINNVFKPVSIFVLDSLFREYLRKLDRKHKKTKDVNTKYESALKEIFLLLLSYNPNINNFLLAAIKAKNTVMVEQLLFSEGIKRPTNVNKGLQLYFKKGNSKGKAIPSLLVDAGADLDKLVYDLLSKRSAESLSHDSVLQDLLLKNDRIDLIKMIDGLSK